MELILLAGKSAINAINIQNFDGDTPMHNVLLGSLSYSDDEEQWEDGKGEEEDLQRVILLIKYAPGFDFTLVGQDGYTVLHMAALRGPAFLELLLDVPGVDLHCRDRYGGTPLMVETIYLRGHSVNVLLKNGASVNQRNDVGMTAYRYARRFDILIWTVSLPYSPCARLIERGHGNCNMGELRRKQREITRMQEEAGARDEDERAHASANLPPLQYNHHTPVNPPPIGTPNSRFHHHQESLPSRPHAGNPPSSAPPPGCASSSFSNPTTATTTWEEQNKDQPRDHKRKRSSTIELASESSRQKCWPGPPGS